MKFGDIKDYWNSIPLKNQYIIIGVLSFAIGLVLGSLG